MNKGEKRARWDEPLRSHAPIEFGKSTIFRAICHLADMAVPLRRKRHQHSECDKNIDP